MHIIKSGPNFHILKQRHPEDGKNEHDKKQEECNVNQSWEGHDQWKEKGSNPLGSLDETQNSANFRHSNLKNAEIKLGLILIELREHLGTYHT